MLITYVSEGHGEDLFSSDVRMVDIGQFGPPAINHSVVCLLERVVLSLRIEIERAYLFLKNFPAGLRK